MTSPIDLNHPSLRWKKAERSANGADACVEVAAIPQCIGVRDSKDPHGPKLAFDRATWATFADRVRSGELDL